VQSGGGALDPRCGRSRLQLAFLDGAVVDVALPATQTSLGATVVLKGGDSGRD
jgi:hypothetical protein